MSAEIIKHPTFGNRAVRNVARPRRKTGTISLNVERRRRLAAGSDLSVTTSKAPASAPTHDEQVHAGLLEGLEKALEDARAGRITGAMYVFQTAGKSGATMGLLGKCYDDDQFALSHAARLLHYVNLWLDERR